MMTSKIEIEYKNLLTEEEFHKLRDYFSLSKSDFFVQKNEYFDTPDFSFKERGCALRVGQQEGNLGLTFKEPEGIGLLETTDLLTENEYELLLNKKIFPQGKVEERLKRMNIRPGEVVYFGSLTTWRAERAYKGGLLVLDKSHYLNKTDYEVEYEVKDPVSGEKEFLELLNRFQIPKRKTWNKIQRFYREKLKMINDHKRGRL